MPSGNIAKTADLRGQTLEELKDLLKKREDELLKIKFQHATGQLENTAKKGLARKELARLRTIIAEKSQAQAQK
jgi:large subunit ribosomal protein L29